ncbi:MAG: RNA polymerase subunit sigma-70 [Pseudomonadota bacterium]
MRKTMATTATLALLFGFGTAALAAQGELNEVETVAEWDMDADGNVSQEEFMVTAATYGVTDTEGMFMQYDRNGDGMLDTDEQEVFDSEAIRTGDEVSQ